MIVVGRYLGAKAYIAVAEGVEYLTLSREAAFTFGSRLEAERAAYRMGWYAYDASRGYTIESGPTKATALVAALEAAPC